MKKLIAFFLIINITLLFIVNCSLAIAFEYTLAPNDTLEIKIVGQKDLDTKQTIAPDGTISMPFLGRITASGKTLSEFDAYLKAELGKYIEKPPIRIISTV
jgi:polysaccharide export outer membrane protein